MKLAGVIVIAAFCLPVHAGPGKKGENQDAPVKIQTGGNALQLTPLENFRRLIAPVAELDQETRQVIAGRALQAELNTLAGILPPWCLMIPPSVLLYVGFEPGEAELDRAWKFIRLALFVRDMYDDYPINHDMFLTFETPIHQRLSDRTRYRLVAQAFLEAYSLLSTQQEVGDIDLLLSRVDVGSWALHYLQVAGEVHEELAFQAILGINQFANSAIADPRVSANERNRFDRLASSTLQVIRGALNPVFTVMAVVLLMSYEPAKIKN